MQTIYVGNKLINDIALGKNQIQQIWAQPPVISTINLQYWLDASFSASAINWRSNFGNVTGSLTNAAFNSSYPPKYVLTGANNEINFSTGNPGSANAARTTTVTFNTATTGSTQNIVWFGNPGGSDLIALQIASASAGGNAYLQFMYRNSSDSETKFQALNLGAIQTNRWYVATLQTTGSTFAGVTLWLNNVSQSLSGSTSWTTANTFWINGAFSSAYPFSGSIQANLYYNSYISQSAVLENYEYYRLKLAL